MKLMHHPDAEVQKQALLCVQKLMLAKDKLQVRLARSLLLGCLAHCLWLGILLTHGCGAVPWHRGVGR